MNWADGEVEVVNSLLTPVQVTRLLCHNDVLRDNLQEVADIKQAIYDGDLMTAKAIWGDFTEQEQTSLWVAPTKGGIFTTREREQMKSKEWHEV
jgi:hypothetical protein